ncbi:MAG: hypothetical protein WCQ77_07020 [Planctomycetota bacterium]
MGRSGRPTTLAICCRLPASLPTTAVEACLKAGRHAAVPVTWIVAADRLPLMIGQQSAADPRACLAVEITGSLPRQALRQLLVRVAAEAPGLDAAAVCGPVSDEHRRVLVDAGIRVVYRDQFDASRRGSRRPAPHGWPCRSEVWGLWEVTHSSTSLAGMAGMIGRFMPWGSSQSPPPGGLSVLDISAASLRDRIEQWNAWAQRHRAAGPPVFATLSDLPSLIAGAGRRPVGGSILRAA